jgi:hypothetical protein
MLQVRTGGTRRASHGPLALASLPWLAHPCPWYPTRSHSLHNHGIVVWGSTPFQFQFQFPAGVLGLSLPVPRYTSLLKLPKYASPELLKERLLYSLESKAGFDLS